MSGVLASSHATAACTPPSRSASSASTWAFTHRGTDTAAATASTISIAGARPSTIVTPRDALYDVRRRARRTSCVHSQSASRAPPSSTAPSGSATASAAAGGAFDATASATSGQNAAASGRKRRTASGASTAATTNTAAVTASTPTTSPSGRASRPPSPPSPASAANGEPRPRTTIHPRAPAPVAPARNATNARGRADGRGVRHTCHATAGAAAAATGAVSTATASATPPVAHATMEGRRVRDSASAASSHGAARAPGWTVRCRSVARGEKATTARPGAAAHRGRPSRRPSTHVSTALAASATAIVSRPPATALGARSKAPVTWSQADSCQTASEGRAGATVRAASGNDRPSAQAAATSAPSSRPRAGAPAAPARTSSAPAAATSATTAAEGPRIAHCSVTAAWSRTRSGRASYGERRRSRCDAGRRGAGGSRVPGRGASPRPGGRIDASMGRVSTVVLPQAGIRLGGIRSRRPGG